MKKFKKFQLKGLGPVEQNVDNMNLEGGKRKLRNQDLYINIIYL